jgi:hypothetical protein
MTSDHDHAFHNGLAAAVALMRAGATTDEIRVLLDEDPAWAFAPGGFWRLWADYQRRPKGY